MIAEKRSIPIVTVFPLEDILLQTNRGSDARQVWDQSLIASGNGAEIQPSDSLVFNHGFEFDAFNGGLDWHLDKIRGVGYAYDTQNPYSGKRSLRIMFDGSQNMNFQGVWQEFPVQPNTHYQFLGYLRTAGLTTDSGVRFLITFPATSQQSIVLANLTGDNPWQAQSAEFVTPTDAHLLRIIVLRAPSDHYENRIEGTAWVDDVRVLPSNSNP
jgi:hypothetical protein